MRRYGNMDISYRMMAQASGCSENQIMSYVRILEQIMAELDK